MSMLAYKFYYTISSDDICDPKLDNISLHICYAEYSTNIATHNTTVTSTIKTAVISTINAAIISTIKTAITTTIETAIV